ncbi:hypothetical protein TYRP_007394 [Tyrophagus putrescentiae]|nr:hypothetical protein TYRP_007394 [Tyrophagus putrescentiae]
MKFGPGRPAHNAHPQSCSGEPIPPDEVVKRERDKKEKKLRKQLERQIKRLAQSKAKPGVNTATLAEAIGQTLSEIRAINYYAKVPEDLVGGCGAELLSQLSEALGADICAEMLKKAFSSSVSSHNSHHRSSHHSHGQGGGGGGRGASSSPPMPLHHHFNHAAVAVAVAAAAANHLNGGGPNGLKGAGGDIEEAMMTPSDEENEDLSNSSFHSSLSNQSATSGKRSLVHCSPQSVCSAAADGNWKKRARRDSNSSSVCSEKEDDEEDDECCTATDLSVNPQKYT